MLFLEGTIPGRVYGDSPDVFLLQPAHAKERFENYDPDAPSLSDADARLLIANQEGYAYWGKGAGRVGKNPFFGRPTGKPNLSAPMLTKAER